MKLIRVFTTAMIAFSTLGFSIEVSPLEPILGSHRVLTFMGDVVETGQAEVVDDGSYVGLKLREIPYFGEMINTDLISPKAETEILTDEKTIKQHYSKGTDEISIEYQLSTNEVTVVAKRCSEAGGCEPYDLTFSLE